MMVIATMFIKQCLYCKKDFKAKSYAHKIGGAKYCSSKCYHNGSKGTIPWNKGLLKWQKIVLKGKWIKCKVCNKPKYFEPNQLKRRPCLYCSVQCARQAMRKDKLIKYSSIHARIKIMWGKADICQNCNSIKNVDWANLSGNYLLQEGDWMKLCRKCHIKYDKDNNKSAYKNYLSR